MVVWGRAAARPRGSRRADCRGSGVCRGDSAPRRPRAHRGPPRPHHEGVGSMIRTPVSVVVAMPQPDQVGKPKMEPRGLDVAVVRTATNPPGFFVSVQLVDVTRTPVRSSDPVFIPLN